jgi:hypothetical protein
VAEQRDGRWCCSSMAVGAAARACARNVPRPRTEPILQGLGGTGGAAAMGGADRTVKVCVDGAELSGAALRAGSTTSWTHSRRASTLTTG